MKNNKKGKGKNTARMGRRKLKIERLETLKARQQKYSKRISGILKKAKELSVLCDVDVALLIFSPSDTPTVFVGRDKGLSDTVERLSKMTFEEREERKAYTLEVLKKIYANTESEFEPKKHRKDPRVEALELHEEQLKELRQKYDKKSKILRDWKNPDDVDNLAQIKIMEDHLIASLDAIKKRKIQLAMEQRVGETGLEGNENLGNGNSNPGS